jgi:FAD dependent oxidoreductase.
MLAPFAELETAESIIFDLGRRSMELWKPLLKDAGVYDGLNLKGTIITAHAQDISELEHFITSLKWKVKEAEDIEMLDSQQLAQIEPELGHHSKAFYLKDEGQVDSQRFIAFSTNYFDSIKQITWREHTKVDKIEDQKSLYWR